MPAAVDGLKQCTTCGETKPVSEYHKNRTTKDGFQDVCKSCRSIAGKTIYKDTIRANTRLRREANKNKHKISYKDLLKTKEGQTKFCNSCKQQLSYSYFGIDRTRDEGFQNCCRQCKSKRDKKYKSKPEIKAKSLERSRKRRREMPAGVYMIRNIKTNKIYFGQSRILYKRINDHLSHFKNKTHDNVHIRSDIRRFGADSFEISVVKEYPSDTSREILFEHEQRLIDEYLAEGKDLYNIRTDV
tara:strand:+ start:241 stop:969 length:729 start_codon:yes stop_codon:yes gene_type:complete